MSRLLPGYGGLEIDQAKRMKDLERENVRLSYQKSRVQIGLL
jgi:hypothetical protein